LNKVKEAKIMPANAVDSHCFLKNIAGINFYIKEKSCAGFSATQDFPFTIRKLKLERMKH
jgi:hypothetical protein